MPCLMTSSSCLKVGYQVSTRDILVTGKHSIITDAVDAADSNAWLLKAMQPQTVMALLI